MTEKRCQLTKNAVNIRPYFSLLASALIAFTLCGCDRGPVLVPVTGSVTARGKVVEVGRIIFEPLTKTEDSMSAIGDIAADGTFTLYTHTEGDGVTPGKYYPVVLDPKNDTRKKRDRLGVVTLDKTILEVTADGENDFPIDITAKDLKWAIEDD